MTKRTVSLLAALALLMILNVALLFGCTKLTITRVTESSGEPEGLRYYRPFPYLLVSETVDAKTGKASMQHKIIYLPDLSQEYAISVRAGYGSVDFKPSLENGWNLVGLDSKLDSKTKEVIDATASLFEKGAKAVTGAKTDPNPVRPGIYRFVYDRRPRLPDGTPNLQFGKIIGVNFDEPIAAFEK